MKKVVKLVVKVAGYALLADMVRLSFGTLFADMADSGWLDAPVDEGGDFATGMQVIRPSYEKANHGWVEMGRWIKRKWEES